METKYSKYIRKFIPPKATKKQLQDAIVYLVRHLSDCFNDDDYLNLCPWPIFRNGPCKGCRYSEVSHEYGEAEPVPSCWMALAFGMDPDVNEINDGLRWMIEDLEREENNNGQIS